MAVIVQANITYKIMDRHIHTKVDRLRCYHEQILFNRKQALLLRKTLIIYISINIELKWRRTHPR